MQFQNVINDLSEGWSKKDQERFDRLKDKEPSEFKMPFRSRRKRRAPKEKEPVKSRWGRDDVEKFNRLRDKAPSSYSIFDFKRKRRKSPSEDK